MLKITPSPAGGITDGMHRYTEDWQLVPVFEGTTNPEPGWGAEPSILDAVQLDNFQAAASIDTSTTHVARSEHTLTYSMKDYRPGLPQVAGNYDYLAWMRGWIDDNVEPPVRGIQINWKGLGITNHALPWIDILAGEVGDAIIGGAHGYTFERWKNFDPEVQAYKRTLAYHKIRGMAFEGDGISEQDAIETLETCLLFGMAAGFKETVAFVAPFNQNEAYAMVREHNARVMALYEAGWEPLTHASTGCTLNIERYGNPADGVCSLVVHNFGNDAVSGTVTLSAELGFSTRPNVVDRLSGDAMAVGGSGPEWTLEVADLEARRSLLLEIKPGGGGGPCGVALPPGPDTFGLTILCYLAALVAAWLSGARPRRSAREG